MNKGRFERSMEAAEVIYDALCIKTNCIDSKNKVVRADYVIAIDDDPTSAFWATWLYYRVNTLTTGVKQNYWRLFVVN